MDKDNNNRLVIRPRGEDGKKVFSIRIDQEIYDRIDDLSLRSGRSRNDIISMLLAYALDNAVFRNE